MKRVLVFSIFFLFLGILTSCDWFGGEEPVPYSEFIITEKLLSDNFIGNGAQWGGYEIINSWTGQDDFNEDDWATLEQRIDFMRPPFIRIMISAGWNYMSSGDEYNTSRANSAFHRIMQYCTDHNITVMFGEWGHVYINNDRSQINETWLDYAVDYLDHLINEKGYTCIKYYNMVNEPNGDWSSTNTNYATWKKVVDGFLSRLDAAGLSQSVKFAGPDIAVFSDANASSWITNTNFDFGEDVGLYEIHTYPSKSFVDSEENYLNMLKAYKNAVPEGKQAVVGEIGLKYYAAEDAALQQENQDRINADDYSSDDSNMLIYDGSYGIDISNALIQAMMAGYSGALVWDMDDAMYNGDGTSGGANYKKLKRWGFWNILGEEAFGGSNDEEIRPFFYPVSLLCRYFPAGSEIYEVEMPDKKGLRAIAAKSRNEMTIAVLNTNYVDYKDLSFRNADSSSFNGVKKYLYTSKLDGGYKGKTDANALPVPLEENISMELNGSYGFDLPGQSMLIFTNVN